jgi:ABC-2 type transport system permease protein
MSSLLRTEWLKMSKYPAFWWLTLLTALSYPGINYIGNNIYDDITHRKGQTGQVFKMLIGTPYTFPEVWHTEAFFSSCLVFVPAVLVIMFITNEYTFKTHRQNVIDGWSRSQFLTSKMVAVLLTTLLVTLIFSLVAYITGTVNTGPEISGRWSQAYYIMLFALQTFAQLSIAFLIGFFVRKAFIALGIFLFYFLILENIAVGYGSHKEWKFVQYLPLEVSDRLIPPPEFFGRVDKLRYEQALRDVNIHILYTVLLTALIWFICFRVNARKDL